MTHYLLSVHSDHCEDDPPSAQPPTDEAPTSQGAEQAEQESMQAVMDLEADMRASGTFLFSGALTDPGSATVVHARSADGTLAMTDGPYAEAKEHIGGFYVIDAPDLDAALVWAGRVVEAIGAPIEVRPFHHLGT